MSHKSRKLLWTACLGNLFEHYDTALFGLLIPFLAPLIFPEKDPLSALIYTYAIIPISMLARPLGALFLGYIGDVYGRQRALFLSLAGMSLVSLGFAFSPTYFQAGLIAPLLFCIGRALQNFLSAGETMGGAILLLENGSEKRKDFLSGLYNASSIGGHILASLGIFILGHFQMIAYGWRGLYLFGCLTALFGCLMRKRSNLIDSPKSISHPLIHQMRIFWSFRKPLLLIVIHAGFASATASIALVLMNGLIPMISNWEKAQVAKIHTYLLLFDCVLLPFFGWLAGKISREKLMLSASLSVMILAPLLLISLKDAGLIQMIAVRMCLIVFGVAFFAPFHAWAQELILPTYRYSVLSFGYTLGYLLLGSPTSSLSLWCFQKTGWIWSISWYWTLLALSSSLLLFFQTRMLSRFLRKPT